MTVAEKRCKVMHAAMFIAGLHLVLEQPIPAEAMLIQLLEARIAEQANPTGILMPQA